MMQLLDKKLQLHEGYANDAEWRIRVDVMPELSDLRFRKVELGNGYRLYWGELSGFVRFFAYDGPSTGFGGHHFPLTMDDGSVETLIGPWSSRAGVMNAHFPHCVEVGINGYAGAVTLEWALANGLTVAPVDNRGELIYLPAHPTGELVKPRR